MRQLLIVHHDAEIGVGLLEMVREFAPQPADYVTSAAAAHAWAAEHAACALLLVQLQAPGIDGLALSGSLGEIFPGLQTFFLPAYGVAAQPLEVAHSKIFPEPINGERLLESIARAGESNGGGDLFHLVDLLQMCCLSGKSGAVQMASRRETGVVFLHHGELRHAVTAHARGMEALYEMLSWGPAEFAYDGEASPAEKTIEVGWDAALAEVVLRERGEQAAAPGESISAVASSHLTSEPDLTGQQFGSYRVGRKLSEGFCDKVYEAEQISIGRSVVLHLLRRSLREDPDRVQEFLESASANANIRHPAILSVYDAGEFQGCYFYVREFVAGRTLYEMKTSGLAISTLLALRIIRALAEALAHLDAHQILHAPLRLTRIFITPEEEVRLAEIAVAQPALAQLEPAQAEIQMLGRLLVPMTKPTALPGSGRVLKLIQQMQTSGEDALIDWATLAAQAKALEAMVAPAASLSSRKTGKARFWRK